MESLSDLAQEDVPETRFLLEMNFTDLSNFHIETQKYWTLAVKAALSAQDLELASGARAKQIRNQITTKILSRRQLGLVALVAIEQKIRNDSMHQTPEQGEAPQEADHIQTSLELFIRKRLHPSTVMSLQKSNKRLRKPD